MSPVRVGINGFGRIGRCVVRAAIKHQADIEFVAVNDIVEPATLAHLLAYDSVYGPLEDVSVDGQDIIVGALAKPIRALAVRDPAALPWPLGGLTPTLIDPFRCHSLDLSIRGRPADGWGMTGNVT